MRRVFFGLEIPAKTKARLLQVRTEVAGAKWQSVEQLHLTSLFLGNIDANSLSAVRAAVRNISLAAFKLDILGLDCFGQPHAPKHLWAKIVPDTSVINLHEAIKNRVESLGIEEVLVSKVLVLN